MCATWVPQIIGAVPGIQHGESRVTTVGPYSPNVAMSIAETWWSFRAITSDPGELLCGTRIVVYNLKKIRVLKVKFYTPAAR